MWRTLFMSCVLAVATGSQAKADEWERIFIPARNGEYAQIFDPATRKSDRVLNSIAGERPQECPPEAFWGDVMVASGIIDGTVVSCDNGKAYGLKPTPQAALMGGYALVPDPDPDKTDKPGPSKTDPAANEVAP